MKIAVIVEGDTERAFAPFLRRFLKNHLTGRMPKLDMVPYHGRIPRDDKLKRDVQRLLSGKEPADHVIALTDVYTGATPPDFTNATDAKRKMRQWVGPDSRFHPHTAQYEFEAWLLPYWPMIQRLTGSNRSVPSSPPEQVNHQRPPSFRIEEAFRTGNRNRGSYMKARDAGRILRENDLTDAIQQCPELKALVNTIITVCGGNPIP